MNKTKMTILSVSILLGLSGCLTVKESGPLYSDMPKSANHSGISVNGNNNGNSGTPTNGNTGNHGNVNTPSSGHTNVTPSKPSVQPKPPVVPSKPPVQPPVVPSKPPVQPQPPVVPSKPPVQPQPPVVPSKPPVQPPVVPPKPPVQPPVVPPKPPVQPPVVPPKPPVQPPVVPPKPTYEAEKNLSGYATYTKGTSNSRILITTGSDIKTLDLKMGETAQYDSSYKGTVAEQDIQSITIPVLGSGQNIGSGNFGGSGSNQFTDTTGKKFYVKTGTNLKYADYGIVTGSNGGGLSLLGNTAYLFAQGHATKPENMPNDGTVLYRGNATFINYKGTLQEGKSEVTVSFGVQNFVAFKILMNGMPEDAIFTTKAHLHGNKFYTPADEQGLKVAGTFYGPRADEVAGVYGKEGNAFQAYAGTFGASVVEGTPPPISTNNPAKPPAPR